MTIAFTSMLYLFISAFGFLYSSRYTCGNILLNFGRKDVLVAVARGALSAVIMLNCPLLVQPCRKAAFRMLMSCGCVQVAKEQAQLSGNQGNA